MSIQPYNRIFSCSRFELSAFFTKLRDQDIASLSADYLGLHHFPSKFEIARGVCTDSDSAVIQLSTRQVGDKALVVAFYVDHIHGAEAKRLDKQVEKVQQRQQKFLQAWLAVVNKPGRKIRCRTCRSLISGEYVEDVDCPVCGEKGLLTQHQARTVLNWQAAVAGLLEQRRSAPLVPDKKGRVHWLVGGLIELKEE